ncbi:hypothetical protein [Azospirillum sp. INR13]|uniref:DUF6969 family protein n=1 Tax=Azospirillum sp. INR13 TaxID=2596919 RepID=UPI00351C36D4
MTDLSDVSREELEAMAEAGREVRLCQRVLAKTGDTVVGELLRGHGTLYEWKHYPPGDVYDAEFHAQYYYHCHPEGERPNGEHGAFPHLPAAPRHAVRPAAGAAARLPGAGERQRRAVAPDRHRHGRRRPAGAPVHHQPLGDGGDLVRGRRRDRHARRLRGRPCPPVLAGQPLDHRDDAAVPPTIVRLLRERDAAIRRWADAHPDAYVYEDRGLEVASQRHISVEEQIAEVAIHLRGARRRRPILPEPPSFVELP